jgi:hypothetical protein
MRGNPIFAILWMILLWFIVWPISALVFPFHWFLQVRRKWFTNNAVLTCKVPIFSSAFFANSTVNFDIIKICPKTTAF